MSQQHFKIARNDRGRPIAATVYDAAGDAVDLTGASGTFTMVEAEPDHDPTRITGTATISATPTDGGVSYAWGVNDLDIPGDYLAEFTLTLVSGLELTAPGDEPIKVTIRDRL